MKLSCLFAASTLALCTAVAACVGSDPESRGPAGAGAVGASCSAAVACDDGLTCRDDRCQRDDTSTGSSSGSSSSGSSSSGSSSGTIGGSSSGSDAQAPTILSLSVSKSTVAPGESVIVSAVVTDPQGVDDLIGGTLENPEGGTYGALATAAQEGTYSLELGFAALAEVGNADSYLNATTRVVDAIFYDQAGHQAKGSLEIQLACPGDGVLCGSACVSKDTRANCGACGATCSGGALCETKERAAYDEWPATFASPACLQAYKSVPAGAKTCRTLCTDVGMPQCVGAAPQSGPDSTTCETVPSNQDLSCWCVVAPTND